MRKITLFFVLLSFLMTAMSSFAVNAAGVVTISEGRGRLLRGPNVFKVREGVHVMSGDIVDVGEGAHVQVEFTDGTSVGFGSQSSVLLTELPSGAGKPGSFFLLSGWVKASGPATAGGVRASTPVLSLVPKSAVYVVHGAAGGAEFFVEAGEIVPSAARKRAAPLAPRKAGEFGAIKVGGEFEFAKRPTSQFLADMPRLFTQTLPTRFEKFAAKTVEPLWESEISFADADRWLKAYPYDRKKWLDRIGVRLKDKDFRAQAERSRATSPDWEYAFPAEKQLTKLNKP